MATDQVCRSASNCPLVVVADHELLYRWFAVECLEDAGRRAVPFATVLEMLGYLNRAREPLLLLVDERSLKDERIDGADLERRAAAAARLLILADDTTPPGTRHSSPVFVPKPSSREALIALVC